MIKIEIKSIFGTLLFTHECDENTIRKTVEKAVAEGANLEGANLIGANLRDANKIPMYCKWPIGITDGLIHIGCKKQTIEQWDVFFASNEVYETPRDTDDFKHIEASYLAYKAYLTHISK